MGKGLLCVATLSLILYAPQYLLGCSYCDPSFLRRQTFRQDAGLVKQVFIGPLVKSQLDGEKGSTDIRVESILRDNGRLTRDQVITLPRYVPVDPKNPPRYLLFGDFSRGKFDLLRGTPLRGDQAFEYLRGMMLFRETELDKVLRYCFQYLDSPDVDVAEDAFLEFAKASDQDVSRVAKELPPQKLRKLLRDPKTPIERLGLFAYLLGACGQKSDREFLIRLLEQTPEKGPGILSGVLGGLIELDPKTGWSLAAQMLKDEKRGFSDKLGVISTIRFYHACKPKDARVEIIKVYSMVIRDGELADMAIEDLRRWQWWDLTVTILAQYPRPTHAAPIVKRSIVRYALCCPEAEGKRFLVVARKMDPKIVEDVERELEAERASGSPLPR